MAKLFVGNWKTYLSDDAAEQLCAAYVEAAESAACDVVVAPSFTALERAGRALVGSKVALGAQDASWTDTGAHTGEIPTTNLSDLGVAFVIVGHSERRLMGETDETVGKKAAAVAQAGMTPIVCVGETKDEMDAGERDEVVRRQLEAVSGIEGVIVAYEPRWAIGTGVPCPPEDAVAVHEMIKSIAPVLVLYGGSVDASNIASYVSESAIDGVLVGGASTKADQIGPMLGAF